MSIEQPVFDMSEDNLNRIAKVWFADLADPDIRPEVEYGHDLRVAAYLGITATEVQSLESSDDFTDTMSELKRINAINLESDEPLKAEERRALRTGRAVVRRTLTDAYDEDSQFNIGDRNHLTGMYTEKARDRQLRRLLSTGDQERRNVAEGETYVGMADATNFKRINDILRHAVGDECIKEAALILDSTVRPSDIPLLIHRSGDEFYVILGKITAEDLEATEERIYQSQAEKLMPQGSRLSRYESAWTSISAFKDMAGDDPAKFNPTVRMERTASSQGLEVRMLYINGMRICPLGDIVVLALGFDRMPITDADDFIEHSGRAEGYMEMRKNSQHELMGGADRK